MQARDETKRVRVVRKYKPRGKTPTPQRGNRKDCHPFSADEIVSTFGIPAEVEEIAFGGATGTRTVFYYEGEQVFRKRKRGKSND